MGNHALQAAMSAWTAAGFDPDGVLFDEAIHAAADETADAYEKGPGGLGTMRRLARRISVYFSEADSAMHASFIANLGIRLGYDGPSHKDDPALYQPMIFRSVDCTAVRDYNPFAEALASHQYYRRSRVVRDDIAAVLDGRPVQNGISQLFSVG
jgi:esterase/lipase superfamily enzyme